MDHRDAQLTYSLIAEQLASQYTQGPGKQWIAQRFLESRGEHEPLFLTQMREQFYQRLGVID